MDLSQLEAEYNALKARVDGLTAQFDSFSGKLDAKTDPILQRIINSSVSWLIVSVYTFGVFTLGAMLF